MRKAMLCVIASCSYIARVSFIVLHNIVLHARHKKGEENTEYF